MTGTPKHSVSVAAVIFDDTDRVLLIQRRDTGQWQIPGGVLELDEAPLVGLRREVYEETGVAIDPGPLTGLYKNMPDSVLALVFRGRITSGTPVASEEAREFAWVAASEVGRFMTDAWAVRVFDAIAPGQGVAIRTHDGEQLID